MVDFRQAIIVAVAVATFVASNVVFGDPIIRNQEIRLLIEGAHSVSEGAYFRFWLKNNYPQPIYVTINDADTLYILSGDSIDYNVAAPQISVPYTKITYTFKLHLLLDDPNYVSDKVGFTVLVLDSSLVQVFDIIIPLLIILAIVLIAAISVFIIRRKRASGGSVSTKQKET